MYKNQQGEGNVVVKERKRKRDKIERHTVHKTLKRVL